MTRDTIELTYNTQTANIHVICIKKNAGNDS